MDSGVLFLFPHNIFGGLDSAAVKPTLVTTEVRARSLGSACDRVVLARPRSVIFSGLSDFLHHVRPQNANIRAFENAFISSMSFSVIEVN